MRDASRALLHAEKILSDAGKVTKEWKDVWQGIWRDCVASSVDFKELGLQIASLQSHVMMKADIISRHTFLKIKDDFHCLYGVPLPSDEIAVMRTGVILHIRMAMNLLGLGHSMETENHLLSRVAGESLIIADGSKQNEGAERKASLPLKSPHRQKALKQWQGLLERAHTMHPVERYIVRGIVYRRHLVDVDMADEDGLSEEDAALLKRPVAWLYLRPSKQGRKEELPACCTCIPIVLDHELPEIYLPTQVYLKRSMVKWRLHDRVKYYSPPKGFHQKSKSTGAWRKGTIVDIKNRTSNENLDSDPWHSILVEFDNPIGERCSLSPWDIEIDPEEEMLALEDSKKTQQAVARARRARSLKMDSTEDEIAQELEEEQVLQQAIEQEQRSSELLHISATADVSEPNAILNDFYSDENIDKYQTHLSELGSALFLEHASSTRAQTRLRKWGKSGGKASSTYVNTSFPTGPLIPGQQVSHKILEALRILSSEQFMTLITNFYMGLKGRYKIPTFAHKELDLFTVWWAVMQRGGYETVTNEKRWKDICRCLKLDLSGQTSASYNMRLNYERCLLDFENYLACGQYEIDLAANKAPIHTHSMNPAVTRFNIPGAYEDHPPIQPPVDVISPNATSKPSLTTPDTQTSLRLTMPSADVSPKVCVY